MLHNQGRTEKLKGGGRDLRRALFSLKQIFQDDEELVHEFVKRDGLNCLVKVFQVDIDLPSNELI